METTVEFRGSKRKAAWLDLGGLGFFAAGILMGRSGHWFGWAAVAFFGLCVLVGIVQLIAADRTLLRLGPDGFSMTQWGRGSHKDRWLDVEAFWVSRMMWSKVIAITYSSSYSKLPETRAVMRKLTGLFGVGGFEGIIPNQYTERLETICTALNQRRRRYG